MIKKIFRNFVIFPVALILTSCAYQPNLKFNLPDVDVSRKKIDAELKFISVTMQNPLERSGPPVLILEREIPSLLQRSLKDALDKNLIFKDQSNKKVDVIAKIFKLNLPHSGITMTTEVGVKYEIIDRKTEEVLFSQNIFSLGSASMEYITGAARSEESINRAIRSNITLFLQKIEILSNYN